METTRLVQSITDDQIAEIEALANDAAPFDWGPDIGMTHAEAVYACSVGPDSILALITRLREAERDAARYRFLSSRMVGVDFDWQDSGESVLCFKMPDNMRFVADCDLNIDAAMQEAKQ